MNIIESNRNLVRFAYQLAEQENDNDWKRGKSYATEKYIYPNQKSDAIHIVNKLKHKCMVNIIKRTKVGADGLMIEIAKELTTYPKDEYCIPPEHIFFITGMSNKKWEIDFKRKVPFCFQSNIFHHGQLSKLKSKLQVLYNACIFIDEIDCGDGLFQSLHKLLESNNLLNIDFIIKNKIKFVLISATMSNELREFKKWDKMYWDYYRMTIPDNYIGHRDFLRLGIIQPYYALNTEENIDKWICEDILERYTSDYRIHLVRTCKTFSYKLEQKCKEHGILFKNHTHEERISDQEMDYLVTHLSNHLVIAIKGFYRRSNLIPNSYKLKIGCCIERYAQYPDMNVMVQGLTGRMSGYWKSCIENGHKTGPYRVDIESIEKYEDWYSNPFDYEEKNSKYSHRSNFISPLVFQGSINTKSTITIVKKRSFEEIKQWFQWLKYTNLSILSLDEMNSILAFKHKMKHKICRGPNSMKPNSAGFYESTLRSIKKVYSCDEIERNSNCGLGKTYYRVYPCYKNIKDEKTIEWWLIF